MSRKNLLDRMLKGLWGKEAGGPNSMGYKPTPEEKKEPQLENQIRNNKNRHQSKKQEKRMSEITGMAQVPGSGSGPFRLGDLKGRGWHLEDKSTRQSYWDFERLVWTKIKKQSIESNNRPALAVHFEKRFTDADDNLYEGPLDVVIIEDTGDIEAATTFNVRPFNEVHVFHQQKFAEVTPGNGMRIQWKDLKLVVITLEDFVRIINAHEQDNSD